MSRYVIFNDARRQWVMSAIKEAPVGTEIRIRKPGARTLEQNNLMWALLTDLSNQVSWHGKHLNPHQWKLLLSAGLVDADVVPSIDGKAFVILGLNTSDFEKVTMAAMIDLIYAFGAENEVEWSHDLKELG